MPHRDLLTYWPREDDVTACVKTDAEATSEAVSLAVHQPMRFERCVIGGAAVDPEQCDEHELLRAFMAESLPEGRVILPIVGSSGIGKSHVIRWLDAQLRRLPDAERRVVIRIPKGTSLKGVLTILLDQLHGAPYERYRRELTRAQQELDPHEAAGLLCEMLAHTLGEMATEARTRLRANPADKTAQDLDAFCRADMLPALLRNQLMRDQHFVRRASGGDGVAKRLVEQLTEGRAAGVDDDRQHLFTPEDLLFDDRLERDALGRDEKRAISQIEREDRRVAATRILNAALDGAKQRLLRLDPTVSDLFDAVRKELLGDKKELILLIEDFAVLSGLQKQVLQVIIKEAIRDGRQVLCTMRTALAYTAGYMDTATVLTRANVEYRIPDAPGGEEEILARIKRLVGAYLNAARLGQAALETAYQRASAALDTSREWVPSFAASVEPEARATLDAFGSTIDGYELFPFNGHSIDELAREGCVRSGHLVYNPRFVIQNVVNKVLIHRDLFDRNGFPPASFGATGRRLPARVAEEVKRRVPPGDLDRYLRFLVYWGGCPSAPDEITNVEPRVFTAFGLDKSLFGRDTIPPAGQAQKPRVANREQSAVEPAPSRAESTDSREAQWERTLEDWRRGRQIPQAEANQIRKWIAEALKEFIDLDWDLFRPLARDVGTWTRWFSEGVYIPKAAGHGGRTALQAMVVICAEEDLEDEARSARVHANLMALVRFHEIHRCTWDYQGAEDDLPRYASFVEQMASQARSFICARYFRAEWDPIPAIVQGLLVGARVLGIEGASRDEHGALISALFAPAPEDPSEGSKSTPPLEWDLAEWPAFVNGLRTHRCTAQKDSREQLSWTSHLLNLVGARQGQAGTVHAIDLLRVKPAIEAVIAAWEFSESLPNPAGVPEFASVRTAYLELKKQSAATHKTRRCLHEWRSQFLAWSGDPFKKDALVRELKDTVEGAKAAGLTGGMDTKHLLQLVEDFRMAEVVTALEGAKRLAEDAPTGTVLAVLGCGYWPTVRLCNELRHRFDEFLAAVDGNLAGEEEKFGEDPLEEAKTTLDTTLSQLDTLLNELH
jgi:hypothetical protein